MSGKAVLYCSFCGKSADEVEYLIAGPVCCICSEDVALCSKIISERRAVASRSRGGQARAAALSPERRSEISRAAARARWAKPETRPA